MVNVFMFQYFKGVTKYTIRNQYYHTLILLVEYLPLFSWSVLSVYDLNTLLNLKDELKTIFVHMIVKGYSFGLFEKESKEIHHSNYLIFIPLGLYFLFIFVFFFLVKNRKINKRNKSKRFRFRCRATKYIFYNFYDTIVIRCFNIYLIEFILYSMIVTSIEEKSDGKYVIIFLSGAYSLLHLLVTQGYFNLFHIYIQLNEENFKYPYDSYSAIYDKFLYMIKAFSILKILLPNQEWLTLFFDIAIIGLIYLYSIFSIVYFNHILTNKILNYIRLFLPLFNCVYLTLFFLFGNCYTISVIVIVLITSVLFSVMLIKFRLQYEINTIIKNTSNKEKCLYLINEFMEGFILDKKAPNNKKQQALKNVLTKIIISHEINCKNNQCHLCSFELTKLRSDSNYQLKLLRMLYKGLKNSSNKFKGKEFDLIELMIKIVCEPNHNYNKSLNFHKLLRKYENKDTSITLNIQLLHHFFLQRKNVDQEKVLTMNDIISLTQETKALIKEFKSLIFVKEHNPLSFIASALVIKKYRDKIKICCKVKPECEQNYDLILICFIVKYLFNSQLKNRSGISFDLSIYEENLNDKYLSYNYLVLMHNMSSKTFEIKNAGKEFSIYTNKNIEELFMKDMQTELLKNLLAHFKQKKENTIFAFPIKDWRESKFIQSFEIRFFTFPSINCEILLINGLYKVDYEDLLVFSLDNNSINWNLTLYNRKLEKNMIISIEKLNELNHNQKHIELSSVFDIETFISSKENTFVINYRKYAKQLLTYFKYDKQSYESTQSQSNLKSIKFKEKMTIKGLKNTYKILTNEKTAKKKTTIQGEMDSLSNSIDDELDSYNNNLIAGTIFTNLNSTTFNYSQSSLSPSKYSVGMGYSSNKISEQEQLKADDKKKRNKVFKQLTYIIVSSNVFLVIITIVYLIVDNITTTNFKSTFRITSELLSLEIKFLHSNLNLFAIMCVEGKSNRQCTDYYQEFNAMIFPNNEFDLKTYFFRELISKSEIIANVSSTVKTIIYKHNNNKLISILEKEIDFYFISNESYMITAKLERFQFADSLIRYSNMINMVIDNEALTNEPIFLFRVTDNNSVIFDNKYKEFYSQYQITMYEFFVNYVTYLNLFYQLKHEAFNVLELNFKSNRFVTQLFPLLLLGFHFVLYIICVIFIGKFERIVQTNIQEIMKNIHEDKCQLHHLFEKIKLLKQLSKFLIENPVKIIRELDKLGSVRKNEKIKVIQQANNTSQHVQSTKIYFSQSNYKKITLENKILLNTAFLLCLIYFIFFYFFANNMIDQYLFASNYISYNSGVTSCLLSGVGMLNIILLTDRDDNKMNEIINNNNTQGYIDVQLSLVHQLLKDILILQEQQYSFIPILQDTVNLSCETVYVELNDSIINMAISNEGDIEHLIAFCNHFDFMKFRNEYVIIYELGLQLHYLKNELEVHNDTKRYSFAKSNDYFSLVAFTLLVFRPIRIYYLDNTYPQSINIVTSENSNISLTILFINIIIEIIILCLIKFAIINVLLEKNSSLIVLNKCLK